MAEKNDLDQLLDKWQDVPDCHPQLKHRVWTRIASSDNRAGNLSQTLLGGLISALARPLGATLFILASIACGILLAEVRVQNAKQVRSEELARNYIQLVNSWESPPIWEVKP